MSWGKKKKKTKKIFGGGEKIAHYYPFPVFAHRYAWQDVSFGQQNFGST